MPKEFVLYSDHQALQYINSQKKLNHRYAKWFKYVQEYTFVLKHCKGIENKVVDALSRVTLFLNTLSVEVVGFKHMIHDYPLCRDFGETYASVHDPSSPSSRGYCVHNRYLFRGVRLCIPSTSLRDYLVMELHVRIDHCYC